MQNKTAYLVGKQKFEIKDSPMPEVGPEDVMVKVKHVGVCGSDVNFFARPDAFDFEIPFPTVLGHECAGEVVQVGADVTDLKEGDLVALEPGKPCGKCEYCRSGKYNLCRDMIFMAAPPFETGAMSTYVSHPACWCFKLPEGMDTMEGALVEPLAVGMHAVNRANVQQGKTVLILGSGCIGLTVLLSCLSRGVDKVVLADLSDFRLKRAKELGAFDVINSGKEDIFARKDELTDGKGFDFVFETAGSPKTAAQTPDLVKPGGNIVMVGNIMGETPFNFFKTNEMAEVNIISVFRYANIYPTAIATTAAGTTPTKKIVSNVFKFDEVQKAYECALNEKEMAVKVVIEME